jgi:hypothetical protein
MHVQAGEDRMNTEIATKEVRATVTKSPSDGKGTFEFSIDAFNTVDADHEKITGYTNVDTTGTEVDVDYGHLAAVGGGADPLAAKIGTARVKRSGDKMLGSARLDLTNSVAMMVHERLLLPSDDKAFLGEVSVWFAFDPAKTTKGKDGVRVIHDAELLSVAIVKAGAQATAISNVKEGKPKTAEQYDAILDSIAGKSASSGSDADLRRQVDDLAAAWLEPEEEGATEGVIRGNVWSPR